MFITILINAVITVICLLKSLHLISVVVDNYINVLHEVSGSHRELDILLQ